MSAVGRAHPHNHQGRPRRVRSVVVPALLVALITAAACSSSDIGIGRVEVELDLAAQRTLQRNGLRAVALNAVSKSPKMSFHDGRGGTLRVAVVSAVPAQGSEDGRVRVSATVARKDGTLYRGTGEAFGQRPVLALAATAVEDAIADISTAVSVTEQSDKDVLALVAADGASSSARAQGVRLLAQRRVKGSLPLLLPLLESEDSTLADAALDALAELKDPAAVNAIIAYAEGKPNHVRRRAIDAIREMPTLEGAAWLFTLSTGHADADVRASATTAFNAVSPAFVTEPPPALAQRPPAANDEEQRTP